MLTYWIVYALVIFVEQSLPFVFWLMPGWKWLRVPALIWLLQFERAQTLYNKWLVQILSASKRTIKAATEAAKNFSSDFIQELPSDLYALAVRIGKLFASENTVKNFY